MCEKGDSTVLKIVHIYRILSPTTFNEKESNKAANAEEIEEEVVVAPF